VKNVAPHLGGFSRRFYGHLTPSFRGEAVASRNARRYGIEPGIQKYSLLVSGLDATRHPGMTDASAFLDSGFARAKGACAPE
jgi:hypothetical protein